MSKPKSTSLNATNDSETGIEDGFSSVSEVISGKSLEQVLAVSKNESAERQIALFWADMRVRWSQGQSVTAESYVPVIDVSKPTGADMIVDLIYSEYALREEHGEQIPREEYSRRFPQYAVALERQIALHEGLHDSAISMTQKTSGINGEQNALPARIGKYAVIAKIGEGGQCTVYRAIHPELGIEVAIKIGRRLSSKTVSHSEEMQTEGQLLSELQHPNLARVHDLDFEDDRPFLVLEYVRGPNLRQFVQQSSPTPQQAASLIADMAEALSAVHRCGILHLDVKPTNIAMDDKKTPRLIDFGLSRRFDAWSDTDSDDRLGISGTVQFMSPEQASGNTQRIDQRSDIFSLGATFYFLLAGRPPYATGDLAGMIRQAQSCEWDRDALDTPGIPRTLRRICRKAMATNPEDRYATMDEFAEELNSFHAGPQQTGLGRATIAAAILLPVLLSGWLLGWFSSADTRDVVGPEPPAKILPLVTQAELALKVRVFESDKSFHLADVVPMENGDRLQVRVAVPPKLHASLFAFTSDGQLMELARVAPSDKAQTLNYPTDAGQAVPLTGPPGTEFLFVCADDRQPISIASLETYWSDASPWPSIPDMLVLRVGSGGVEFEQRAKGFGPPSDLPNPETVVIKQLEQLQRRLSQRFAAFEGIVFAHRE